MPIFSSFSSFFRQKPQNYIIADVNKMTAEQDLRQCFYDYAEHTGETLLPKNVISEIVERIKLNLSAQDLIFGVNEILQEHNIQHQNHTLFENFIIACKLFDNVRKRIVVFTTQESQNQLDKNIREDLQLFENKLIHKFRLETDHFKNSKPVNFKVISPILQKLKIPGLLSVESEKMLDAFGLLKCSFGSELIIKEFLKIEGEIDKVLIDVKLRGIGNHIYSILASNIYYDEENNLCFDDGLVIDILAREIYPVELMPKLARVWDWNDEEKKNYSENVTPEMLPPLINICANEIAPITPERYYQKALTSFTHLYNAIDKIIDEIESYVKPEDPSKDLSSFLEQKKEDLFDLMWNINFASQYVTTDQENITLIDRLNDQIENFYTTLFCKILSIPLPKQGALFFDNSQYWQDARAYMSQCAQIAEHSILNDDVPQIEDTERKQTLYLMR